MGLWSKGFERSKKNTPRLEDKNELKDLRDLFGWDNHTEKFDTLKEIVDFVHWECDYDSDNNRYNINMFPKQGIEKYSFNFDIDQWK